MAGGGDVEGLGGLEGEMMPSVPNQIWRHVAQLLRQTLKAVSLWLLGLPAHLLLKGGFLWDSEAIPIAFGDVALRAATFATLLHWRCRKLPWRIHQLLEHVH